MLRRIALLPCIFIYKLLYNIIKLPIMIVVYFFKGLYFVFINLCLLVFNIFKYFIYGISLPVRIIYTKLNNPKKLEEKRRKKDEKIKAKLLKQQVEKENKLKKEQEKLLIKEAKEQEKIKKIEAKNLLRIEQETKKIVEETNVDDKKSQELVIEKISNKERKRLLKEEKNALKKAKKQERIEAKKEAKLKKEQENKAKQIQKLHDENIKKEQYEIRRAKKKQEKLSRMSEKKRLKALEKEKKLEEKKAKKEQKKLLKQKENENYVNDKLSKEKVSFGKKLSKILKSINSLPTIFAEKMKNNSFAKNRRNKKDISRQALLIDFESENEEKSDVKLLYKYEAKDKEGKLVTGYFEAFSRVEVHSFLLSEGYEVYSIKTSKWITLLHGRGSVNNTKFKTKDLIFFLTQLSTYLKAGIPLVDSLRILAKQFKKNKAYQRIFKSIIYELTMGEAFSSALTKQNVAFPKLLINMIKTAEMTGELPEVLDDMADYYTQSEETKRQMVSALTYPSIVFVFAMGVITFILLYVIPKFVEVYNSMDESKIPGFTKAVIKISDFLKDYIILIFVGIGILLFLFILSYKKIKSFRTVCQWVAMRIPIFGTTIIYNEVTLFTKTFSSLLKHNVSITECMDLLNKITNNEIYHMLILDTVTNLARGGKISEAFEDHWAFPIPAYEMIVTGERTGELAEMLNKVSIYYQGLHKNMVGKIKTFIEPLLTVFLTVIVGVIVISIVVPMFNMYSAVQGS